jgi:hypothetical protein
MAFNSNDMGVMRTASRDEMHEIYYFGRRSRDSAVGIANGYGLDDRGVGVQELSLLHVGTGSGVHPTSYPMGNGGCFPGV